MCGHTATGIIYEAESEPLPDIESAGVMFWDITASGTESNELLLFINGLA
jgi:hypothetical protein